MTAESDRRAFLDIQTNKLNEVVTDLAALLHLHPEGIGTIGYHSIVLTTDQAEQLVKLAKAETLLALLKEAHEFPDYPSPGEGMDSDAEDWAAQESWRQAWDELDKRVKDALTGAAHGS